MITLNEIKKSLPPVRTTSKRTKRIALAKAIAIKKGLAV